MTWAASVVGQKTAIRSVQGLLDRQEGGRFVMIHGPMGTGKATMATQLMSALLCRSGYQRPCGNCLGCRTPAEHPDGVLLAPEKPGGSIGVDAVRQVMVNVWYPPMQAPNRVWVIDAMDDLTASAANGLLRLLEEPPSRLWVFGIAHNASSVPVTIRSRAYRVPFSTLMPVHLEQVLGPQQPEVLAAGTVHRASLILDKRFQANVDAWNRLVDDRWYDPDAVNKFARSLKGRDGVIGFFLGLVSWQAGRSVAPPKGVKYNEHSGALHFELDERAVLLASISDLEANVNPAFVCENAARDIRQIRKQARGR